jgi:hypothetical protein
MKKILSILLILTISKSLSQNINNLDTKFGISKFKLESDISLYKKDLTFDFGNEKKGIFYTYKSKDVRNLFDVKIKEITLGFYKNKLFSIIYEFGVLQKDDEIKIMDKLDDLFGQPTTGKGGLNIKIGRQWLSKKTKLIFIKNSLTAEKKPGNVILILSSVNLEKKKDLDQF